MPEEPSECAVLAWYGVDVSPRGVTVGKAERRADIARLAAWQGFSEINGGREFDAIENAQYDLLKVGQCGSICFDF